MKPALRTLPDSKAGVCLHKSSGLQSTGNSTLCPNLSNSVRFHGVEAGRRESNVTPAKHARSEGEGAGHDRFQAHSGPGF